MSISRAGDHHPRRQGRQDRRTILPRSPTDHCRRRWSGRGCCHGADFAGGLRRSVVAERAGAGSTRNGPSDFGWQYVFPGVAAFAGPARRPRTPAPCRCGFVSRAMKRARDRAGIVKARHRAYLAAFVRDAFAGGGLRHSHDPGIARAQGRGDDPDLHACAESRAACGVESAGSLVRLRARD